MEKRDVGREGKSHISKDEQVGEGERETEGEASRQAGELRCGTSRSKKSSWGKWRRQIGGGKAFNASLLPRNPKRRRRRGDVEIKEKLPSPSPPQQ